MVEFGGRKLLGEILDVLLRDEKSLDDGLNVDGFPTEQRPQVRSHAHRTRSGDRYIRGGPP